MPGASERLGKIRDHSVSPDLLVNTLKVLSVVFALAVSSYLFAGLHLSLGAKVITSAAILLVLIFGAALYALPHHRHSRFGYGNLVTAIRAAIVSIIGATVFFSKNLEESETVVWTLVAMIALALVLDGTDGYLARRHKQESEFGARFDMEIDALHIVILSYAVFILGKAGAWVLMVGLMRYAFVLAQTAFSRLQGTLQPSFRRSLICVVQVAALCVILVPVVAPPVSSVIAAIALTLLIYSFAVDIRTLLTQKTPVRMALTDRYSTTVGIARSLLVYYGQPWRRSALKRFYRDLIAPDDLVFDIGAHVGSRSQTLLSLGADVVAVEPQPVFADFIERHFAGRLKALERVAVGASEGEITLRVSSRHPTVASISSQFIEEVRHSSGFRKVVWDRAIQVPVTTLDDLIARHGKPAFCKIDVEGAEAEILQGLNQPLPLIAFEYIPAVPSVAVAAVERLSALGNYRFNRVIGERHHFIDQHWTDSESLLRELEKLSPESPSGDVYARLEG